MFEHLRSIGPQKRLALYLYSHGGAMEAPWKIVTMLREFCDELYVIVPYRAQSAATMIAIGADKIHMSKKGELGPIDPALQVAPPKE
jgi:ClpP class serine protease